MKYICGIIPNADGMVNGIQSWNGDTPPNGYAFIGEEFFETFNSTSPCGFVYTTVVNGAITEMTVNTEAYEKWKQEHPEPEPTPEPLSQWDEMLSAYEEGVNSI